MDIKSTTGLFAIISPENTVSALFYLGEVRQLFRNSVGEWLDRFAYSPKEQEAFDGILVPVVDDFIDVYDKAVKSGKKLFEEDAYKYLRDAEF